MMVSTVVSILLMTVIGLEAERNVTPFTLKTIDNELVPIDSLLVKGPVLITFWAMWCKPCKEELHALKAVCADPPFNAVTIVAVNNDTPRSLNRVKTFVETNKFPFVNCSDPGSEILRLFNISGIPFTIILYGNREVAVKHAGYVPGDVALHGKAIEKLLPEAGK
jgi:thiol-disulfide isomerase/thioredoxin